MSVYAFGDYHKNDCNERYFLELEQFPESQFLSKKDTLIILGDTGLLAFSDSPSYNKIREEHKFLCSQNYTILCVMGNHENWDIYDSLPIINKWNGKVKEFKTEYGSLYFTISGEVYSIENKTFFVVNGALSIDKDMRTQGIDWFPQETLTYTDTCNILDKAEQVKEVDYLLTHTVDADIVPYFTTFNSNFDNSIKYKCHNSEFLSYLRDVLDFKENLFGHFHIQKSIEKYGIKYSCFYKQKPKQII